MVIKLLLYYIIKYTTLTTGVTNFSTENSGAEFPADSDVSANLVAVLSNLGVAPTVDVSPCLLLSLNDEVLVNALGLSRLDFGL